MIDGFTKLGNTIHGAMQNVTAANSSVVVELGKINSDMSLTTDSFKVPIPKGDYMVDIALTSTPGVRIESYGSHTHTFRNRVLKAGDRVVVMRVGTERIVTNIVTSSSNI